MHAYMLCSEVWLHNIDPGNTKATHYTFYAHHDQCTDHQCMLNSPLVLDTWGATASQVLQKFTNYRARHMADDHKKILGIVCRRKFRAAVWAVVAMVRWQNARASRAASVPLWVPAHLQLPSEMDIDTQLNAAHDTATWLDMAFENEMGWGGKLG